MTTKCSKGHAVGAKFTNEIYGFVVIRRGVM